MPSLTEADKVKSSWADQMEDETEDSGDRQVEFDGNKKVITEVTYIEGVKTRISRHYHIEKRKVTVAAAKRKNWKKFGQSVGDGPGPNFATTIISQEELRMEYLNAKEETGKEEQDPTVNQFGANQSVTCRNCGLNHWTLQCPYKNQLNALNKLNENAGDLAVDEGLRKPGMGMGLGLLGKRGMELATTRPKDENNTIRITNLPEETQDSDIRDLFKDFGRITRIFLAKDKATGNSKGFAFVSFEMRDQAARAIKAVNGHGYNNLILSVEWARPSAN